MVLTGLSTEGITQMTEEEKKVSSCPVWKCNYTSVSIWSSTVRCRKPDTSSLSSAKLAFGSVMSELLDSSSAGIPLPTYPRPVSSHIAAAMSDEASQPAEHHGIPVPLSPWQLVTCMHPTPSLPPSPCRFPVSLSFPYSVFKTGQKCKQMTIWLTHTALNTLSLHNPVILYPEFLFLSVSFDPTSSIILTLRSHSEMPPILLESSSSSLFTC